MNEGLRRSRAQEKRGAAALGGTRNPGSGNGWSKKNDVRTETELIEYKCRAREDAKSISIKVTDLRDVEKNSLLEGRRPLLGFDLGGRDYVILTVEDYMELRDVR